jgi:serine/threonine protein kinase
MEYCNGSDLKEIMEIKGWKVDPSIIQQIMASIMQGFSDMMDVLVIHRDLKL